MGKESLVTRFEVFIEAKIHPMHIRHYGMEAFGVGWGGVWRNSYTQIQHRPEEGVCGHHVSSVVLKEKARIIPQIRDWAGPRGGLNPVKK